MSIALGPFDLIEPVARGGMAEVWRARHRAQDAAVAVKVVTAPAGREQAYREQFVHEVQAMARLHHPAVVRLHEYGEISTALALASKGALPAGAPFLAMEWLDGGSLRDAVTMDWPRLRATMLTLLDALAHAHAQGVVHRDLKPDNVLVGERGPVLTDFGLAFNPAVMGGVIGGALDSNSYGTPGYMAPEQIRNDWRAFGPWTDLYALGCMAYELVCGFAPHADRHAGSAIGLLVAHLQEPLPALRPRFAVPAAFERWLLQLMGRTPPTRFQFAADAAVSLIAIPDEVAASDAARVIAGDRSMSMPFASTVDAPAELALAVLGQARASGDDDDLTVELGGPYDLPLFERLPAFDESLDSVDLPGGSGGGDAGDAMARLFGGVLRDPDSAPPSGLPGATVRDTSPPALHFDASVEFGPLDRRPRIKAAPRFPASETLQLPPVFLPITDDSWAAGPRQDGRPPVPASWRRQREPSPAPMLDVGLTLARLRQPPPIGREGERDHLWAALRSATRGRARVVLIEGPAGQGKTHLAAWLARRAHELGIADHLHATHDRLPSAESGPGAMIARFLRCGDLGGAPRQARIEAALAPHGDAVVAAGLAEALPVAVEGEAGEAAAGEVGAGEIEVGEASEISEAALDAMLDGLAAMTERRPLVLWCDDAQWGLDTLRLIERLLDRRPLLPVLALLTIREDAVAEDSPVRARLRLLTERGPVTRLRLGPLSPVVQFQLVRSLCPLAPNLVDRLVERTAGSPQFAVELVRHWISSGALLSTVAGFELRDEDLELSLPGEQQAMWLTRLDTALRGVEDHAVQALEIAAVLGVVVDGDEWSAVCDRVGLGRPHRALARLQSERLVRTQEDSRWAFAHGMLREALQQRARADGRWTRWNALCAQVLQARGDPDPVRLAEHLLAAGELDAALGPLLDAVDLHLDRADYGAAERTLRQRMRALRTLRVEVESPHWPETGLRWSAVRLSAGDVRRAVRQARRAVRQASRINDPALLVRALLELGRAQHAADGPETAWPAFARALGRLPQLDDLTLATRLRSMAGWCLVEQGRYEAAERTLAVALSALRQVDLPRLRGDVLRNLADMARRRGQLDRAEKFNTRAARAYYRAGARRSLARAALIQGDIERYRGKLDEAAARYREAGRMLRAVGSTDAALADINQGLLLIELEQYREAQAVLEEAAGIAGEHRMMAALASVCLLPCAAWLGDWLAWDRHWQRVEPIRQGQIADPDVASVARLAARLAAAAGEEERAEQARGLAIAQLEALGRVDEAAELRWGRG